MKRLIAAAVLSVAVLGYTADRAAADPGDATEKVLKAAKIEYAKLKGGGFKVVLETKEGTTVVVIEEKKAPYTDSKKNDVLYLYIWSRVLTTGTDFKPPTGMLTKICEINDRIRFGSLGLAKNQDGSYSLFRNMNVMLKNLDEEELVTYLYMTHFEALAYLKEFKGYLDDGK